MMLILQSSLVHLSERSYLKCNTLHFLTNDLMNTMTVAVILHQKHFTPCQSKSKLLLQSDSTKRFTTLSFLCICIKIKLIIIEMRR